MGFDIPGWFLVILDSRVDCIMYNKSRTVGLHYVLLEGRVLHGALRQTIIILIILSWHSGNPST